LDRRREKTLNRPLLHSLGKDKRAVSPAISTVILTSAIVVLLLVTIVFANNFLSARMAENEFSAMEQFMQTVGLQIDDVAWTIGRTQTIRYASMYGQVDFQSAILKYSVYVKKGSNWVLLLTNETGIILFNMPIDRYSMGNDYFKRVFPSSDNSFLQIGTSAPITHVFVVEKLPMIDGSYIRIVVATSIRMLNSTIKIGSEMRDYFKFYLPYLVPETHPRHSQSITITGKSVSRVTASEVDAVRINVTFPCEGLGFDDAFFNFKSTVETCDVPDGSVVEFYIGEVRVSLGLYA
jgi:hypothetical protein